MSTGTAVNLAHERCTLLKRMYSYAICTPQRRYLAGGRHRLRMNPEKRGYGGHPVLGKRDNGGAVNQSIEYSNIGECHKYVRPIAPKGVWNTREQADASCPFSRSRGATTAGCVCVQAHRATRRLGRRTVSGPRITCGLLA